MVPLPQNKKQTYRLNSVPQMWPIKLDLGHDLDYEFKGQIWNLPYLTQRWFDCNKMKSTHVEWTKGRNDHQVWTWPWPWKVRYKDLPDIDRGDFRCRRAVDSSSYYTPRNEVEGVYWIHPVRPSVCLSVRPSVRPWVGVRMITLILFSGFKIFFLHISLGSRSCMGLNISVLPH